MKINEIIDEGIASWVGKKIGQVAGAVGGVGRWGSTVYNQGAEAMGTGYQSVATKMGGSRIPNTPGAKITLARYKNDWETFVSEYRQGGEDLSDPAEFKALLDKFILSKYGVDTSKYPAIQLASVSSKSAANYIFAVTGRDRADRVIARGQPETPAPSASTTTPTTPAPTTTTPAAGEADKSDRREPTLSPDLAAPATRPDPRAAGAKSRERIAARRTKFREDYIP
jgi:hypothetical protein